VKPSAPPQSPPAPLKTAAVLTLLVASLNGLMALYGASMASNTERIRVPAEQALPWTDIEFLQTFVDASQTTNAQLPGRALVQAALFFACTLAFVSAARLLSPRDLPLDAMRALTGRALLIAGVLRVIDGAQSAVYWRQISRAIHGLARRRGEQDVTLTQMAAGMELMPAFSVGLTVVCVAALVGLAQYFRSDRARALVAAG
jgi:hypothetical protein